MYKSGFNRRYRRNYLSLPYTKKGSIIKSRKSVFSGTTRNRFSKEYKKGIVKLITELCKKPTEVAKDIGVTAILLSRGRYNNTILTGTKPSRVKKTHEQPDANRKTLGK